MIREMKNRSFIWPVLVALTGIALFLFNYYCIPSHDELGYCWLGLSTPHWGDCPRADSIAALIHQQIVGYNHDWSGRIFVHFIVGFFSGFGLHTLFDVCNALMTLLLVVLILEESHVRVTCRTVFWGFCLVFLFMWQASTFCRDSAFAVNYLWMCCFTILIMRHWRKIKSWWGVPIFFVYGWSQESFVPAVAVALLTSVVWRSVVTRKIAVTRYQIVAWLLMVVGCYYLCTAPAALERAGRMSSANTLTTFLVGVGKNWFSLVQGIWPAALLFVLLIILFSLRTTFLESVTRHIEWWLFTGAAFGSFSLLGANGFHIACAFLLGATVLGFIYRDSLPISFRRLRVPLGIFAFCFFLVGLALQIRIGVEHKRALDLYAKDSQGISYRVPYTTGPFDNTVRQARYGRWALSLFRRHLGKEVDPVFLSEDLYKNLYINPSAFFAKAKKIEGTELYLSQDTPCCYVKKGDAPLTAYEEEVFAQLESVEEREAQKRPVWVPGRVTLQYPPSDFMMSTPSDVFTFVAQDGAKYTIYQRGIE